MSGDVEVKDYHIAIAAQMRLRGVDLYPWQAALMLERNQEYFLPQSSSIATSIREAAEEWHKHPKEK